MEKEYKISWLKVIGILVLIIIVIAILCALYPKKEKDNKNASSIYIENIANMKEAGFEYFKGKNLPDKIGDSKKITLEEMITNNLMGELVDEKGRACNKENSYIKATKTLDNEYSMKVFLSCDSKKDYIVTTIVDTNYNNQTNQNNSQTNQVVNNKKPNSSSKPNSNNKKPVQSQVTTNYNINYVNNCGNCPGSNCSSNCKNNVYYTVTFNSEGGTAVELQTKKYGEKADYKSTTREGYQFLGWYLDGVKYDFSTPITKKTTLNAKWKKIESTSENKKYKVCFNENNGTKIKCQEIIKGNRVYEPNDPTRKCYTFKGWYTNSKLTQKYNFNNRVYEDMTLYAKWEENDSCKEEYRVKFNSNGGSSISNQYVYEGNRAYEPNDPTRKCYTFKGWYTNSSLTKKYNFNNRVYEDMTLYAKWEENDSCKEEYRVKFNSNGGSSISNQYVYEGNRAYEPNDPTRKGYIFKGWYTSSSLTKKYNFNNRVYEDITLYAKWEKEEIKYHTYCKVEKERIYSTNYVDQDFVENKNSYYRSYKLEYVNRNAKNMKVTDYGTVSGSMYNKAYNYWKASSKPITMVNDSGKIIDPGSGTVLKDHSLTRDNFSTQVTYNYQSGNKWYFTVNNDFYNLRQIAAKKYYKTKNYYVYFVPIYFDIEYTDSSSCIKDTAANSNKYRDYEIEDTFYLVNY